MIYKFGKYPPWHNTDRLMDKWLDFHHGEDAWLNLDEKDYTRLDKAVSGCLDAIQSVLNVTINRFNQWKAQKIRVHVEDHDIWSADYTFACMMLPVLEKYRAEAMGFFMVEPEDVPEDFQSEMDQKDKDLWGEEEMNLAHERWKWVVDEMIFALEMIVNGDWEEQFFEHENTGDMFSIRCTDWEGLKAMDARITNGTLLLGKYFRAIWD